MSTQDVPSFSEQAEANRNAASLEVKPGKSPTPESRADAKRRKAIKSQPPLAPAPLAKSVLLHGDALTAAKEVDKEEARKSYVASVQKAADAISALFNEYNGLSVRVEEVKADYLRLKTAKVSFKSKFTGNPEFRANSRLIRDFFTNPGVNEYLLGADGVTQYRRATDYFLGEMNVSYEYVRKLGETVNAVGELIGVVAKPKQPKAEKHAAVYAEIEKDGELAEAAAAAAEAVAEAEEAAAAAAEEAAFAAAVVVHLTSTEAPVLRSVDAVFDAVIAYSRSASIKLTLYERSELQSRLAEFFAGDSHSHTITLPPVEEVKALEA